MNFTSVDPPQVIRFLRTQYPSVVTHAPEKSIYQLAVERGILPSMRIRWCCADLKESAGAGKVTLIGIRKQESARRAKRHEVEVSDKQFSGTLDEFGEWQKEQIAKKEEKLLRKMKREGKEVNEDYFSSNKESEVRCINGKDSILVSPILEWSEADVWYFLNEIVKVPHCELYDQGYKRIGCILCPMSSYKQKVREMKDFPHVKRNWIKAIKAIRNGGRTYQSSQADCGRVHLVEHSIARDSEECQRNAQELGGQNYPPRQQKFGNRYTPTEWNKMFQRLAMEVRRRQEFTPPSLEQESKHRDLGWIQCPDASHWTGFRIAPLLTA